MAGVGWGEWVGGGGRRVGEWEGGGGRVHGLGNHVLSPSPPLPLFLFPFSSLKLHFCTYGEYCTLL